MSTRVVIAARCISIQVMSNSVAMNACWNRNRLPKKTSVKLLVHVAGLLKENDYAIGNIDATIIAQKPKMAPHIPTMRENIAEALGIKISQLNIKATTEEGLGFTGQGEGISSQAICSLYRIGKLEEE